MAEMTTIYVTKDATSRGIVARKAVVRETYAVLVDDQGHATGETLLGLGEFYSDLRGARAAASLAVSSAIAVCEAKLAALQALDLSTAVEG